MAHQLTLTDGEKKNRDFMMDRAKPQQSSCLFRPSDSRDFSPVDLHSVTGSDDEDCWARNHLLVNC